LLHTVPDVVLFLADKKVSKSKNGKEKENDELDQVAGNAEDEIGDRIAAVRETELLYGPTSLLAVYGPMIVHICGSPHKFKVCDIAGLTSSSSTDVLHPRIAHCVQLLFSFSANFFVSVLPFAINTIDCFSRFSKHRRITIFEVTSSSHSVTLPSPLIPSSTRIATSYTRVFRTKTSL
jgi:hypothetical protein